MTGYSSGVAAWVRAALLVWLVCLVGPALCSGCAARTLQATVEANEVEHARDAVDTGRVLEAIESRQGRSIDASAVSVSRIDSDDGSAQRFSPPRTFGSVVREMPPVKARLVLREEDRTFITSTGPYFALAGAGLTGIGLILISGAALIAGPSNDTTDGARVGVYFGLSGLGLATLSALAMVVNGALFRSNGGDLGDVRFRFSGEAPR